MREVDLIWQQGSTLLTGGLLGLLPLVWAGLGFYETLECILTEAWAGQPLRGFLHRKLVTLTTFLCASLFWCVSSYQYILSFFETGMVLSAVQCFVTVCAVSCHVLFTV